MQIQKEYTPDNMTGELRDYAIKTLTGITSKELYNAEELQAKRIGNLSDCQLLKYITLSVCIIETLRYSILFRNGKSIKQYWDRIRIFIDRSSTKGDSREELVFRKSLGWFLTNYTKKYPFEVIEEIHNEKHPLIKKFDTPKGFDGKKLFKHIYFEDSKDHCGLQIIDIIVNTFYKALNDLDNTNGMLKYYKIIMMHNPLEPNSHLGFFFFPSKANNVGVQRAKKYAILQEIIASNSE